MAEAATEDKSGYKRYSPLVLVVDDNPDNRDILVKRLSRDGFRVVELNDAVDLEAQVAELKPDLVLLDWMMPHRSGVDALRDLRQIHDSARLPVVMVTALDNPRAVTAALSAGANDYVTKPIDYATLRSRVSGLLERRLAVLQLDAIRADLEIQVESRTQALRQANDALLRQIEERRAAEARAQALARADLLTGLPNRLRFVEEIGALLSAHRQEKTSFALMIIDLDRFKSINDVHGHSIGDQVLALAAQRMLSVLSESEVAARLGGDEFAVISSTRTTRNAAARLAEDLVAALGEPMDISGLRLGVRASIGIALCPEDGGTGETLMHHADSAMLRAKTEGGSRFGFFDSAIDQALKERAQLEADLRVGIPRGEIVPYFQPFFCLTTGKAIGAEVLARWRHPTRGIVGPGAFIPIAEGCRLIDDLFWALLGKACRQALEADGQPRIAVNVSPTQVFDQWFPEKVLRTLTEAGFPARRLEVEVTETAMFADLEAAKIALTSLKNQGVSIAIDDFGAGYSSLAMLREFPIDKLKIDRSFISGIAARKEDARIVRAILNLCATLGVKVTAEGIEDEATAMLLAEWGCDFAQGYHFGYPAERIATQPANGFTKALKATA
jgi:diguanylate cyclase (GGDEF)-like protein